MRHACYLDLEDADACVVVLVIDIDNNNVSFSFCSQEISTYLIKRIIMLISFFIVQDKEMLHGPSGYGDSDGKFSEYYRAYGI